jgi:hypothetical protein
MWAPSALVRTPLPEGRSSCRQDSTDAPTKTITTLLGLVVARGWMCRVDAAAAGRVWSLKARILRARATWYHAPDQTKRQKQEFAKARHYEGEHRRLGSARQGLGWASVPVIDHASALAYGSRW